ncbi:hypothetical protein POK33_38335 [Burkholderia cenocepacia]|nr:hypothetical protein [Burkholderia cenocepacia]MDF0506615.1 hypothetical protein [Burkholderia cenocepacia]
MVVKKECAKQWRVPSAPRVARIKSIEAMHAATRFAGKLTSIWPKLYSSN